MTHAPTQRRRHSDPHGDTRSDSQLLVVFNLHFLLAPRRGVGNVELRSKGGRKEQRTALETTHGHVPARRARSCEGAGPRGRARGPCVARSHGSGPRIKLRATIADPELKRDNGWTSTLPPLPLLFFPIPLLLSTVPPRLRPGALFYDRKVSSSAGPRAHSSPMIALFPALMLSSLSPVPLRLPRGQQGAAVRASRQCILCRHGANLRKRG